MPSATQSLLVERPSSLGLFVAGSIAFHVLLFGAALFWASLFPQARIDLDAQPIKASLVRLGKPREEKLLPRIETAPPEAPEPLAVPPAPEPAPPPAAVPVVIPNLKPEPKPTPKVDGAKDAAERKKQLFSAFSKTARPGKAEPLEGALDGDPHGDDAKQEGERYYGLLKAAVTRNYDVSNSIPEAERIRLKARVAVRIGPGGELLDAKISSSSGNDSFDTAVLGAVKKASPFAPPPASLRDGLKTVGAQLDFRP